MNIAIVGSGPSAFYAAQSLIALNDKVVIDIFEKLPAPFGLVRYGVAPDHQKTKNIIKLFSKVIEKDNVNLFCDIEVGKHISIKFISENYDAVLLASGAEIDRKLNIEGENKKGVISSSEFVGWYNGSPFFKNIFIPKEVKNVVIIGNGNVALDCARLLAKEDEEFFGSDIMQYSRNTINNLSIENIYIIGRRSPLESKFTISELREIGELKSFNACVDFNINELKSMLGNDNLETKIKKNIELLCEFEEKKKQNKKNILFKFMLSPKELIGEENVNKVILSKNKINEGKIQPTQDTDEIKAELVISAIGYKTRQIDQVPIDVSGNFYKNNAGHIISNIYTTGWAASSSVGVIGTNKMNSNLVAKKILTEIKVFKENSTSNLLNYLKENKIKYISKSDWFKLDKIEIDKAVENFVRSKMVNLDYIYECLNK